MDTILVGTIFDNTQGRLLPKVDKIYCDRLCDGSYKIYGKILKTRDEVVRKIEETLNLHGITTYYIKYSWKRVEK